MPRKKTKTLDPVSATTADALAALGTQAELGAPAEPPDDDAALGALRESVCSCGASVSQVRFPVGWLPVECTTCRNAARRTEEMARQEAWRLEREARDAADRVRQRIARLEVPRRYTAASLAGLATVAALAPTAEAGSLTRRKGELAARYIEAWPTRYTNPRFPMLVVMRGAPGSLKTTTAWAIALELVRQHTIKARVATLGEMIRDLREPWGRRGDAAGLSERARLAAYHAEDLLVIDEVSTHALYGEPRQVLYDLLAPREANLQPTILTTNDDGSTIEELLGDPLVSRVMSSGGIWEFGSYDYRPALYDASRVRQEDGNA